MGLSQSLSTSPSCASRRQHLFGSATSSGRNLTCSPSLTRALLTAAGEGGQSW